MNIWPLHGKWNTNLRHGEMSFGLRVFHKYNDAFYSLFCE